MSEHRPPSVTVSVVRNSNSHHSHWSWAPLCSSPAPGYWPQGLPPTSLSAVTQMGRHSQCRREWRKLAQPQGQCDSSITLYCCDSVHPVCACNHVSKYVHVHTPVPLSRLVFGSETEVPASSGWEQNPVGTRARVQYTQMVQWLTSQAGTASACTREFVDPLHEACTESLPLHSSTRAQSTLRVHKVH